ncbi:MAG: cytochrome c biogenesis protein ResB [Myxococcales bacterium]
MTTAVATSEPTAAAPKSSAAATRAEVKLISLLAGGLILLGALLQFFITPGAVAFVVYTTLMTVTLVVTAYVVRGRLLDAFAGFRLAAVTLTILGAGAALGTLILQNKPASYYPSALGGVGSLILALRLDDLFHSFWFGGVIALMNTGLITSALRRWPITRRNVGFFMVHLGIIVTLVGAGVSAVFSIKGRIDLRVGQSASTVSVTKSGLPTPPELPLNASLQLLDFDVDHYADIPRLRLFLPAKKGSGYDLKASFEGEIGVLHKLPGGNAFRAKAFYPDLVLGERLVETGGDKPALKLTVDGQPTWLMAGSGERQRLDTKDGKVAVVFGWQRPAVKIEGPLHTVKTDKGEPVPVRIGETITLDGMKVTALRYFPQFTYDIATKTAVNVSDRPINPALEVDVDGKTKKWLFANMPGFGHGDGPNLVYAFSPEGGSSNATVLAVAGADKTVLVKKPDGTEQTLPLTDGLELEGVKFGALLEKASVNREPTTASQEMKNPALLVEVTNEGLTREVMMMAGQRDPVEVGNGFLTFETRVDDVKAFRSAVAVHSGAAGSGGEARKELVEVNAPVNVGDWKVYQVNYDPKDPTYSGFEAVRDPGVNWVFVGFGLLFSGVFYMIYVGPRMRRKEA